MFRRAMHIAVGALVAGIVALAPLSSAVADRYWQCVPFARLVSGIQIFGDAHTWWRQATGRYATGLTPTAGSVLCFKPSGAMTLGHVAVVSQVLTDRVIQITHANWSRIGGTRGQIERDVTVIDVSASGDWSRVKVWYDPVRDIGSSTYPTYGFIYPDAQAVRMASSQFNAAQSAALTVAQSAASQVASTIRPGASPLSILGQAADAGDRIAALIQSVTAPPPR
jgi:surface antigen